MFVLCFCFCVSRKFQSFDFRPLLVLGLLAPCLVLLAACGGGDGGGGVIFSDRKVALSQSRSADMHVEKDYDLGAITLRLPGDTRLTDTGAQNARFGVGLHLPLGG